MRQLAFLRHAKSDWGAANLPDHERPLSARGERAALVMGRYLAQIGYRAQTVVCSTAMRTRQTLDLVGSQCALPGAHFTRDLYLCGPRDLIRSLQSLPASAGDVLIVGHNPDIELAVQFLANPASAPDLLRSVTAKYPTAGLTLLGIPTGSAFPGPDRCAALLDFQSPKMLV